LDIGPGTAAEFSDLIADVYTCDPRVVPKARKIERIAFEEMLEMASQGAKVLQTRSVAMAMRRGVRLQVLSSFEETPGTLIVGEDEIVEEQVVTGVAVSREDAKLTLTGVEDRPGVAAAIFGPLADAEINVDMIVQNVADGGQHTDITFTVPKPDLGRATALLREAPVAFDSLVPDPNVAKVSVVGIGMRSHAGVAQRMFATLAARGINIEVISTSEIKISVLIEEEYAELAARALHTAYGLDRDD
ncbi:MAG: aspartate kinase, partial [Alphaproteobacteria bacterium]|nr:aspartate kinase [Alphaproteobacteria bacterium]